jgi:hypothetical protein
VKQDKTADQLTQLMEDFFCTADDWFDQVPSPELHTQSLNWALDTVLHLTLMAMPSHNQLLFDQVGGSIRRCSFFKCFFPSVLTGESYWLRISGVKQL